MNKITLILIFMLYSSSSLAHAPFGLTWGADLSLYGTPNVNGQTVTVFTNKLPESYSKAKSYFLKGSTDRGLNLIRVSSETYALDNVKLKNIYKEVKDDLLLKGYEFVGLQAGTFGSYHCIIQSNCHGNIWHAKSKQGNTAMLSIQGANKNKAYILLEYYSLSFTETKNQFDSQNVTVKNQLSQPI
ncbi:hypothetical protein HWQ46_09450 [Shewanella sp. D64]|uniref:hypothetical protein n=1 Tax=unclassified Shewanella TaxID=196818 RepID=UPI0022BA2166|nr:MULTISPECIES: hypothetical protein [unclassified Shewanella]MEC4725767.1 hypothetical protein [Shewanella sp. D64]MEC4737626.1 hypothetical protein [Shewanella sp. E94]WBJ93439.1 hypothetical protein HWQ47_16035 [Shewanella sp. MTB7]